MTYNLIDLREAELTVKMFDMTDQHKTYGKIVLDDEKTGIYYDILLKKGDCTALFNVLRKVYPYNVVKKTLQESSQLTLKFSSDLTRSLSQTSFKEMQQFLRSLKVEDVRIG